MCGVMWPLFNWVLFISVSTPYSCTTHVSPEQGGALVSHMMSGGVSLPLPSAEEDSRREGQRQWRACAGGGLDTTLLRRHDPILFFDEVLLYQVRSFFFYFLCLCG